MIAVVIDDLGIDRRRTARAIALKGPLTLSFLTYADGLAEQTAVARAAGHELMLHVGMEPAGAGVDPGPNVLTTDAGAEELRWRLDWGWPGSTAMSVSTTTWAASSPPTRRASAW